MSLSGLPRPSVIDDIVERIMSSIRSGELPPGTQLPTEPDLARQMGVGRTSVREALGRLRALGVVEVRRGRGTFVLDEPLQDPRLVFLEWTAQHQNEVLGLFEVRMALEALAASLAAIRSTPQDRAALRAAALDHQNAGASSGAMERLVETDQRFHLQLIQAAHNDALARVYSLLVPRLAEYRSKSLALEGAPTRSADDHLAVAAAVESGDPELARAAILAHLATLYDEVQGANPASGGSGNIPLI